MMISLRKKEIGEILAQEQSRSANIEQNNNPAAYE